MTLAIARPRTVTVPVTFPCPAGVPWCNDEYAAACTPDEHITHWSGEMYLPATAGRTPDGRIPTDRVSLLVGQRRDDEPTIAVNAVRSGQRNGEGDDAEMTLDEAENLGRYLLDLVARLRGGEPR
ncbi:hypothetical protein [Dactylosporangium sp. NPDC051484]|uniref:DUF6907 domain-containing protein n=1 Tax=Dactylosporangium sp. NPDC051484 TaxID=3154942 RepID=UPI00344F9E74